MMLTAQALVRELRRHADPQRAALVQRFFKTGPGEYGEGDRFLGLTVPQVRTVVKSFGGLPLDEIEAALESPWHEARLAALLVMATTFGRAGPRAQAQWYALYMRRTDRINNWDLVDASAPHIAGAWLVERSRAPLHRLAGSADVWERRIAIVATLAFIRRREFADTLSLSLRLANDRHDLIHKAVGWMLREVGKQDLRTLHAFLDRHAAALPRTTLRYAVERLSRPTAQRYMAARGRTSG